MTQIVSDKTTLALQFALTAIVTVIGLWATYHYGVAPNHSGVMGRLEAVGWLFVWQFTGASIVGIVMIALNDLFYWIQVHRHGYPHDNIADD